MSPFLSKPFFESESTPLDGIGSSVDVVRCDSGITEGVFTIFGRGADGGEEATTTGVSTNFIFFLGLSDSAAGSGSTVTSGVSSNPLVRFMAVRLGKDRFPKLRYTSITDEVCYGDHSVGCIERYGRGHIHNWPASFAGQLYCRLHAYPRRQPLARSSTASGSSARDVLLTIHSQERDAWVCARGEWRLAGLTLCVHPL